MTRLLIATTNPAKLAEYRILLHGMDTRLEAVSLADAGIVEVAEETGATFHDNALQKARFYFERSHLPTLADDGGLEVDALAARRAFDPIDGSVRARAPIARWPKK